MKDFHLCTYFFQLSKHTQSTYYMNYFYNVCLQKRKNNFNEEKKKMTQKTTQICRAESITFHNVGFKA